jgi:UDP:flavonoid glycosyltransferase YjiC (YdhE family)
VHAVASPITVMVSAVGWTGHLFPVIALARALRARGHDVLVETFEQWRDTIEGLGLGFVAAEEQFAFPGIADRKRARDGRPTMAQVARSMVPTIRERRPDVLVSDLFTIAPVVAAEAAGVRTVTLIPHVYPVHEPGLPFYLMGLLPPRTPMGSGAWRALHPLQPAFDLRHRRVRRGLNATLQELGLPPRRRLHPAISDGLALVATFPQLEYPRRWPRHVHVTGPMLYELSHPDVELPEGDDPLVLIAPSTSQDPRSRLVRLALEALDGEPVRVIATTNGRPTSSLPAPANAVVVEWLSYSQVVPRVSAVVCHGGHGTVTRSLAEGAPVLVCPADADMAENGARVAWSRTGLMLPRPLLGTRSLRSAIKRLLSDRRFWERAAAIAGWARANDGATRGAELVERYARGQT